MSQNPALMQGLSNSAKFQNNWNFNQSSPITGSTTQNALNSGQAFLTENEEGKNPYTHKTYKKPNWMGIGNAMNFGVAGLAELAGIYDRNMQQQYVNRMQNNPLSGILPFDDMRSDRVEEGYMMAKEGGLFANYWAKRRRGEAAGTRKPNE